VRITPHDGGARVRFDAAEAAALSDLFAELITSLQPDGLAADDPVRVRLFPDGYRDDDEAAATFRDLTESTLRAERLHRAEQCGTELAAASAHRGRLELVLDADATQRWTQVLNDLRLALGTRLDISEDMPDVAADDPDAMQYAVYVFLTGIQDLLVHALMG
jgi:hypothetical protein